MGRKRRKRKSHKKDNTLRNIIIVGGVGLIGVAVVHEVAKWYGQRGKYRVGGTPYGTYV